MKLTQQEIEYLRDLATQVKDIAQDDKWDEKRDLWIAKNSLKKVRPLLMCAIPKTTWLEIIQESSLKVSDPVFKVYERQLLHTIYRYHNLRDDIVLNNKLYIPVDYKFSDWYVGRKRPYAADAYHAAKFDPCLLDYSDYEKLQRPKLEYVNWESTQQRYEEAKAVFGDLLDIQICTPFYANMDSYVVGSGASVIDVFIELRGYDNILLDLYDEPEWCKEVMDFMTDCYDEYYDELEKNHLLRLNNNEFMDGADSTLNSNGLTCLDTIPGESFDPDNIKTENLWGYCMAQEFTMVSPDMLEEFVLPYQGRLAKRFGLNGYGCCENLFGKYDMVKKYIPNLREFSITFTCDQELAVENVKDEYVYSWKPSTTELITMYSEDRIRKHMKEGFEITKDCHVVASLRDTQTLYGEPERMSKWCDISMEVAKEYE